jgi:hypothetical protein
MGRDFLAFRLIYFGLTIISVYRSSLNGVQNAWSLQCSGDKIVPLCTTYLEVRPEIVALEGVLTFFNPTAAAAIGAVVAVLDAECPTGGAPGAPTPNLSGTHVCTIYEKFRPIVAPLVGTLDLIPGLDKFVTPLQALLNELDAACPIPTAPAQAS